MLDAILILFLLCGAVLGFKKGAIKSLVAFVGTILLVIVSYYLKNPVATILFKFVPFIKFSGAWSGLVTLNILLYEALAYLLVFLVLYAVLNILLKVSGIIERVLKATIILGIPSKIIGAVLGFLEALVFSFIVLFVMLQFKQTNSIVRDSSMATSILDKTPIIGPMVSDTYDAIMEIGDLIDKSDNIQDTDVYNSEILDIMLKYEVVDVATCDTLKDNKKLDFKGMDEVLDKYRKEDKNA